MDIDYENFERDVDARLYTLHDVPAYAPADWRYNGCKVCSKYFRDWRSNTRDGCKVCFKDVRGQVAYHHEHKDFWIHKSCSYLFGGMAQHPLHPQHPLTFRPSASLVCNGCGELTHDFTHMLICVWCNFKLDMDCALLVNDYISEHDPKATVIPFDHQHPVKLRDIPMEDHDDFKSCSYCNQEINEGSVYFCFHCSFSFHELCISKFPRQITHPLHDHHNLTFVYDKEGKFVCDGCRYFSTGFRYRCRLCSLDLDLKCGLLMDNYVSKYDRQQRDSIFKIEHFSHQHILTLVNYSEVDEVNCCYCHRKINDSAYICLDCKFFIHRSCLIHMPKELEHPYHPHQHPYHPRNTLVTRIILHKDVTEYRCEACRRLIQSIGLECTCCPFRLHHSCAKPHKRPLKHEDHRHNLFYFTKDEHDFTPICNTCDGDCSEDFYRCLESCEHNFHLDCIPLPPIVQADCHDHPLSLVDSLKGHNFNEYYCDTCEEIGNPKHHVYSCQDNTCTGYIAHIECVITENVYSRDDFGYDSYENQKRYHQSLIMKKKDKSLQPFRRSKRTRDKDKANQHIDNQENGDPWQEAHGVKTQDIDANESSFEQHPQTPTKDNTLLEDQRTKDKTKQHSDKKGTSNQVQEADGAKRLEINVEDSSFEHLQGTLMKEETSKERPPSSTPRLDIDAGQESDVEISSLYAEMEALTTKLKDIKGKRGRELKSMISSSREKIMELRVHLEKAS